MTLLYPPPGRLVLPPGMCQPIQFPIQPYLYVGSRRLAGYKGPWADLQPVGGGTAKTIGFNSTNHAVDMNAAIDAIGAKGLISKLYDQSGNGRHLTQTTAANMPSFNIENRFGGMMPCIFDGSNPSDDPSIPQVFKWLNLPTVSLGSRATTMFFVLRQLSNGDGGSLCDIRTASAQYIFALYWSGAFVVVSGAMPVEIYDQINNANYDYMTTRNDVTVIGFNFGSSNVTTWSEGATATSSTLGNTTATNGYIGGESSFAGTYDLYGCAVFNSSLSAANMTLVANALLNGYTLKQSYDSAVICDGDSRMSGFGVDYNQGLIDVTRSLLGRRSAWYNQAVSGQTAQSCHTNYGTNISPLITSYAAKGIPVVYVAEQGVNDAAGGTSASTTYNSYIKPTLASARSDGAKTVCCTIMHETSEGGTEGTIINSLNTLIKAGAGTDFDALCDMDAIFPSGPPSPTYSKDGTHCNNAGNDLIKSAFAQAIYQAIVA